MPIVEIINISFRTGIVPDSLKRAAITPLFKKDEKSDVNNYRPIAVLPLITKIMESFVQEKLSDYLNDEKQAAYRKFHSTEMMVNLLASRVHEAWENQQPICCVFIDLSKAFDTVTLDILIDKMVACGITGSSLKWFRSLLVNHK
jgi:hypothetical protein